MRPTDQTVTGEASRGAMPGRTRTAMPRHPPVRLHTPGGGYSENFDRPILTARGLICVKRRRFGDFSPRPLFSRRKPAQTSIEPASNLAASIRGPRPCPAPDPCPSR
jgi:hypothetical protein